MENKKTLDRKTLVSERVENLMLMAVLGQEPYRGQARRELRRRWLVASFAKGLIKQNAVFRRHGLVIIGVNQKCRRGIFCHPQVVGKLPDLFGG